MVPPKVPYSTERIDLVVAELQEGEDEEVVYLWKVLGCGRTGHGAGSGGEQVEMVE